MLTPEQARPLYQNDAAHNFDHVLRVLATAERIGAKEGANLEILRTAALLHDIARAEQGRTGKDHAVEGSRLAREILKQAGEQEEFIKAVCHAVATHRFRGRNAPKTLEAKILYDADKLDAIGAVGVARAFAYGGHKNRPLWRDDDSGERTTLQEFRVKLCKVKDKLFTPTARKIADRRHQYMVDFFEQITAEITGIR